MTERGPRRGVGVGHVHRVRGLTTMSSCGLCVEQAAEAAVEQRHIALQRSRAEVHEPGIGGAGHHLDAHRVAGQAGLHEAHAHFAQPLGLAEGEVLQQCAAGEAHVVEPVRDRPLEAGATRDLGVGMDGHVVAAGQAVDEGGLARRWAVHRDGGAEGVGQRRQGGAFLA
jgi:hypothetical protein